MKNGVRSDKVSSTALMISQAMLLFSRTPRYAHLIKKEDEQLAYRVVESSSNSGSMFIRFLDSKSFRWLMLYIAKCFIPGLFLHVFFRKEIVEQSVRQAILDGCTSVTVLAAGFDGLAHRLHKEYPNVTFVEIDLPATQNIKKKCILEGGHNLHFVPADLSKQNLSVVLSKIPEKAFQKSMIVAEGLLMYLTESEVKHLLAEIGTVSQDIQFLFSFIEPTDDGRIALNTSSRFAPLWLAAKKETFKWGIAREALPEFMKALQYKIEAIHDTKQCAPQFDLHNEMVAQSEPVCMARLVT